MLFKKAFSLIPLLAGALVDAYGSPGACSGACWSHDPTVIQRVSDGTYFRFDTGSGIQITKATSLSGSWTIQGYVLPSGSKISITGNDGSDAWAPDVKYVSGTYYLYYAISSFGSQVSTIGVATSTTLEYGSWTDHGATGVASTTGKNYNAIDPNLLVVGSTYLLNFGSFWGDIYQVPLSTPLLHGSATAYNLALNSTGSHAEEGSYIFYYSGYYYLLISSGICCGYDTSLPAAGTEYRIIECRSTSATSGFVDKDGKACTANGGSTLLKSHGTTYGPGGQGVFTDSSLGLVLYYHYADTDVGLGDGDYKFGWNQITWSDGWPVV